MRSPSCRKNLWIWLYLFLAVSGVMLSASTHSWARSSFGIIDFRPSAFTEQAASPFFFSIGRKLKFGRAISESASTLFEGKLFGGAIIAVFPSPDGTKAAVVSGGKLYLAEPNEAAVVLLNGVENLAPAKLRPGDIFYKYPTLQWDAESRTIYIVRDVKQKRLVDQNFSRAATLIRIDIAHPKSVADVISDFRSDAYFLMNGGAICFDYAPGNGDVIWKCADKGLAQDAESLNTKGVVLRDGTVVSGKPFVSYSGSIYESEIWLTRSGFFIKETDDGYSKFFSQTKLDAPLLVIKGAWNLKGHYTDGILQTGCMVLPGGRYALLNVSYGNFSGQLLVDGISGQYRELPHNTRVYRNLNSWHYDHVKIGVHWPDMNQFVPSRDLRTKLKPM